MDFRNVGFSLVAYLFFATSLAGAESFTNTAGRTIEGDIIKADPAAGTVTIHVTSLRKDYDLQIADLAPESQEKVQAWWDEKNPKPAEWVKPGARHSIEFPELAKQNHDDGIATANISIPGNYDPAKPMPLLVWLTGGKGGNGIGGAEALAGKDDFVSVSLPYPAYEGRDVFDRQRDGGLVEFWEFHKVMLDEISSQIPNLDPRVRVIAGFSNGAHTIGGYFSQVDEAFAAFFNVYVFGDGGVHSADWDRQLFRDRFVYICWGEIGNSNKPMGLATTDLCEDLKMRVTASEMKDVGHQFPAEEKAKVKTWLHETVVPTLIAESEASE